jgi:lipopolysaccharide biosynthesis protein
MSVKSRIRTLLFHGLRLGFRVTPMSPATRDRLRQRFLERHGDLIPTGPRGRVGTHAERRPRDHAGYRAVDYLSRTAVALPDALPARLVAFYLPQFHPIAENDAWWGTGFTEWRNVARALPQFEGHIQPRLPGELGFYDLRLPDTIRAQIELARNYGVGAFCSYFYWFAGKTLLEAPLRTWLGDPSLDLPICLCWANENWSRRWDGRADQVLIAQKHSEADDLAFIRHVADYMRDPRYLRVDGKPMLLVYRPGLLPDARATANRWRQWCREQDLGEIHLAYVQSFDNVDPRDIGFDAAVSFPPNNTAQKPVTAHRHLLNPDYAGQVYDWRELTQPRNDPAYPLYPAVNPGWDNEARRSGQGRTYVHESPAGYFQWLRESIAVAKRRTPDAPLVFINAWNEWAEGAVLEPDAARGHAWLEATRAALLPPLACPKPCAIVHIQSMDSIEQVVSALHQSGIDWRMIVTTTYEQETVVKTELARLGTTAEVIAFADVGRDMLPFLKVSARLLLDGTDIVLKLDTRKTESPRGGTPWQGDPLSALTAPARTARLLAALGDDKSLGAIAPDGHALAFADYPGTYSGEVENLCERMGLGRVDEHRFIAGSMFLARIDALRPLFEMNLCDWEFEDNQASDTLATAIERIVTLGVASRGLRTAQANELLK